MIPVLVAILVIGAILCWVAEFYDFIKEKLMGVLSGLNSVIPGIDTQFIQGIATINTNNTSAVNQRGQHAWVSQQTSSPHHGLGYQGTSCPSGGLQQANPVFQQAVLPGTGVWMPPPSGFLAQVNYYDPLSKEYSIIEIDAAYVDVINTINNMQRTIRYPNANFPAMVDDFSLEEMAKAEKLIEKLEHADS